ncbi:MAG: hypothetical protein JWO32_1531 [Bacteroidetes bacterium]|nr:hypothetical protein [Bacteroidota bacterium]
MKNKNTTPYDVHLTELLNLLEESKKQENPAYWLYVNKTRVPLFMLESLTRLLYKATNDQFAKGWYKFFKKLEDLIGEIDYFDVFIKQFQENKSVKNEQIFYLQRKLDKVVSKFNKKLLNNDFFTADLLEFKEDNETDFKDKALLISLHEQIKTEILLTESFFNKHPNGFTSFESEVHAMRRKLRWISIYGISLGGIVTLRKTNKKFGWEKEFIGQADKNSKYNKLPVKKGLNHYIPLQEKAFYALSHVIAKLGEIKDKGLAIEALARSLEKTSATKVSNPRLYAIRQLKLRQTEAHLLKEAYDLMYKFFVTYNIHIQLLSVN